MIENYGIINDRAPHLVADLCEIMCYFENREVSRGDIETVLYQKGGEGLLSDLKVAEVGSAEANEKFQALSEEVMRHLLYRKTAFKEWYPFNIEGDILVPEAQPTERHKVYAALLGFSRLKMFPRAQISQFASDFERFCLEASETLFGNWKIVHFGAGGRDRPAYGNKLKEALLVLAETLREHPITQNIAELSEQNSGDAGVDIIFYKEWADPARSVPAYFAQCAAQKDGWPEKKFEASAINMSKFFSFFHPPGSVLFIPVCYRNTDGKWVKNIEGHSALVIDRLRLVELLERRIGAADGDAAMVLATVPKPFDLGCAPTAA